MIMVNCNTGYNWYNQNSYNFSNKFTELYEWFTATCGSNINGSSFFSKAIAFLITPDLWTLRKIQMI